jgi:hypothetical protein
MTTELEPEPRPWEPPSYGNANEAELAEFQAALNKAAREKTGTGYRWRAQCPRCKQEVVVEVDRTYGLDAPRPRAQCPCTHNHAGRPEGTVTGCGFDVTIPWKGGKR